MRGNRLSKYFVLFIFSILLMQFFVLQNVSATLDPGGGGGGTLSNQARTQQVAPLRLPDNPVIKQFETGASLLFGIIANVWVIMLLVLILLTILFNAIFSLGLSQIPIFKDISGDTEKQRQLRMISMTLAILSSIGLLGYAGFDGQTINVDNILLRTSNLLNAFGMIGVWFISLMLGGILYFSGKKAKSGMEPGPYPKAAGWGLSIVASGASLWLGSSLLGSPWAFFGGLLFFIGLTMLIIPKSTSSSASAGVPNSIGNAPSNPTEIKSDKKGASDSLPNNQDLSIESKVPQEENGKSPTDDYESGDAIENDTLGLDSKPVKEGNIKTNPENNSTEVKNMKQDKQLQKVLRKTTYMNILMMRRANDGAEFSSKLKSHLETIINTAESLKRYQSGDSYQARKYLETSLKKEASSYSELYKKCKNSFVKPLMRESRKEYRLMVDLSSVIDKKTDLTKKIKIDLEKNGMLSDEVNQHINANLEVIHSTREYLEAVDKIILQVQTIVRNEIIDHMTKISKINSKLEANFKRNEYDYILKNSSDLIKYLESVLANFSNIVTNTKYIESIQLNMKSSIGQMLESDEVFKNVSKKI